MKITMLNVSGRISSEGSRLITAVLKQAGYSVRSVFFSRHLPMIYTPEEIGQLDEVLKDTDLVLVAVYTTFTIRAVQVTTFIHEKYPGKLVIWGGPHCISATKLSLKHADGVCFADGEEIVLELAEKVASGDDFWGIPNMAFIRDGQTIINPVKPMLLDLDSLPYPDFDMEDQFVLDGQLQSMSPELYRKYATVYPFSKPTFFILTARGCPYRCSFCNNVRFIRLHGKNRMRYRSVNHFMGELEENLEKFPFFEHVGFGDDDFLLRPVRELEDFAAQYKKRIGLPFCIATSANIFSRKKLEIILDAGLKLVQMGVQSGSQNILDNVYDRPIKLTKIRETTQQLVSYRKSHGLELLLDFIIDNPYETREDILQTYRYLVDLIPFHFRLNVFMLTFFPGTPIYDRALKDGLIDPFDEKILHFYGSPNICFQNNYPTLLVILMKRIMEYLRHRELPSPFVLTLLQGFLGVLCSRGIVTLASILPSGFYARLIRFTRS